MSRVCLAFALGLFAAFHGPRAIAAEAPPLPEERIRYRVGQDVPRGAPRRVDTVAHRVLDMEAPLGHVTPEMYSFIDGLVDKARIKVKGVDTSDRRQAIAALEAIETVLREANIVYPSWGYVATLGEALTPHRLDSEGVRRLANTFENSSRKEQVLKNAAGVFYVGDCDTMSYLYLGIADALNLPLVFVEIPAGEVRTIGHNYLRWSLPGGKSINWDPMTGALRSGTDVDAYVISSLQFEGYVTSIIADGWSRLGAMRRAVAGYRKALVLGYTRNPYLLNELAWLVAVSPIPDVRAPQDAVRFAEMAWRLMPTPDIRDTLATACASAGDFARAVREQQAAVNAAPEEKKALFRTRLAMFQEKKAYIEARRPEQREIDACTEAYPKCPDPTKRHYFDEPLDRGDTATKQE